MKKFIKKLIPNMLVKKISRYRVKKIAKLYYSIDRDRFINSAFTLVENKNRANLKAKLNLHSHSIEKGLTNINFREGFGKNAYTNLIDTMFEYKNNSFDLTDLSYQNGLSVLNEYIEKHKNSKIDTSFIKTNLENLRTKDIINLAGIEIKDKNKTLKQSKENFESLAQSRYSVRDFSEERVDISKIYDSIKIASKTPSVCNRQPWHTYIIQNQDLIRDSLELQAGLPGQGNNTSYLLAITSDNNYLSSLHERNQGFIDGGMYSMSLLYALHFSGLAACALNNDFSLDVDKKMRKLLSIPNNQNFIMFIAVGNYTDIYKVPKSFRENYLNKLTLK